MHKYLCWYDRVRKLGKKTRLALLQAAAEQSLFTGDGTRLTGGFPNVSANTDTGEKAACPEAGIGRVSHESGIDLAAGPGMAAASFADAMASGAKRLYTAPETELGFLCGEVFPAGKKREEAVRSLLAARKREPARIEEELLRAQIGFVSILEETYPSRLRTIPDPPFGIYWKGRLPEESVPAAAVIGARLASGYGREQARRFAGRLGARGVCVVSGMARGIDGIAQTAALEAGGSSFAVLGCGVDICYPTENSALYELLLQKGGILSEYAPGTQPQACFFPPRNRIISGLSDLVLVIEARKRSGTLITVDMALEQGREVFALPGRVSDSLSDGCNRLIRQGAGAATCPEDILEFFFGTGEESRTRQDSAGPKQGDRAGFGTADDLPHEKAGMSPETAVLQTLSSEDELHLERILESVNRKLEEAGSETIQFSSLISVLMRLRMDGKIREEAGYYRKTR